MALNGNYSTNIVYAPLYPIVLRLLLRVGLPFDLATALIAAGSVAAIWDFALRALSFLTADRLAAALGATFIDLFAFQQPIFEYIWTEQLYAALLSAATFLAVSYCAGSSPSPAFGRAAGDVNSSGSEIYRRIPNGCLRSRPAADILA